MRGTVTFCRLLIQPMSNVASGCTFILLPRPCALLQKQKQTALLNVALKALEERQTAALAALRPATYGNASVSGGQDGLTAIVKAETELVEAQEALVAADERARDSSTAYQTTARYGMPCLGCNTCGCFQIAHVKCQC